MILDSQLFDTWDRCEKRFAYELTHEPSKITPLGLLYAAVEASLTARDPKEGAKDAILRLTQEKDVDVGELSPASAVRHVECIAEVIALAMRGKFGKGSRPDDVKLGKHVWHTNLFDFRGDLHRVVLASHLDDDSLRSYAHAWQTIGEMAALERSITLTVILVGSQRGGRRHSPWAKGYIHPVQKALRFGRRKGSKADGFTEGWREAWREQTNIKAETWLDKMKVDEVLPDLIQSRKVNYKEDDERMLQARRDMLEIAENMVRARTDAPMRRSSCDEIGRGACPWQNKCYSSVEVDVDELPHLYRRKTPPPSEKLVLIENRKEPKRQTDVEGIL